MSDVCLLTSLRQQAGVRDRGREMHDLRDRCSIEESHSGEECRSGTMVAQGETCPFPVLDSSYILVLTKHDLADRNVTAYLASFNDNATKSSICANNPLQCRSQNYADYDVVVLICGGIGVTPMASILSHNVNMFEKNKCKCCGTVSVRGYGTTVSCYTLGKTLYTGGQLIVAGHFVNCSPQCPPPLIAPDASLSRSSSDENTAPHLIAPIHSMLAPLSSCIHQMSEDYNQKRLYFHWATRENTAPRWFGKTLAVSSHPGSEGEGWVAGI